MAFATTEPSVSFTSTISNTPKSGKTISQDQKFPEKLQPYSRLSAKDHFFYDQPKPENKLFLINNTFKP